MATSRRPIRRPRSDRVRATATIAAALTDLTGPEWSKVRNVLNDPRSLAFLDRMHRRLEEAEPRPEWREAKPGGGGCGTGESADRTR